MDPSPGSALVQDQLEDPRGFLGQLLEHAPFAFQIYGMDGHCVLVNHAFREPFRSAPPPEYNVLEDDLLQRRGLLPLIRRGFAGEPVRLPAQWYDPRELQRLPVTEGRRVGIEVSLFPIRDRSGQPRYIAFAVKDVTAEITLRETAAELERSEQRFRATFEQAAVGIAHLAPDGRWLAVNQRLCEIVGYTREELLQRRFQDISHPEELDADLDFVRQAPAGKLATYSMEKRYVRKDGHVVWVHLTVALVRDESSAPAYLIWSAPLAQR